MIRRRRRVSLAALVMILFALVIAGSATSSATTSSISPGALLDQNNASRDSACRYTGWVPDDATGWAAQTFTAGITGDLANVVLWLRVSDARISVAITPVDDGGRPVVSTQLASTGMEVATIGAYVTAEVAFLTPARVEAGKRYAIVLFAPSTAVPSSWTWKGDLGSSTTDPSGTPCADGAYAGGRFWVSSAPLGADADFFFQTYVVPTRHVTVQKIGAGAGLVQDGTRAIDCGSTCSGEFTQGGTLTLTATPDPGSIFTGWSGACTGTEVTCSVTVTGDASINAGFRRKLATLTVHRSGRGSVTSLPSGISCGGRCSHAFVLGAVKLTAKPSHGWRFARWQGACQGTTPSCRLVLVRPRTVTAIFAKNRRN